MDFFIGFAEGIEAEIGNPEVCAKEANLTLHDIELGYSQISNGIWSLDVHQVEQGLQNWALGLNEMAFALRDCGINKLSDDIERIALELASGVGGILRFLAEEILNVIDNDVYGLFRDAIKAYEQERYTDSGKYTGQIVGILLNGGK